jgi:ABC-2 type transport system permease protein
MTSKLWRVALHEYKRHVLQKGFVVILLSLPLTMALMIGIGALSAMLSKNDAPVGYVDKIGLLAEPVPAPQRGGSPDNPGPPDLVPMIPFETEEMARAALEAREIQAYYVVTTDYFETYRVQLVYAEPPGDGVTRQFWDFMQINLLTDLPPEIARRAVAGSNLVVRWPEGVPGGGREFSEGTFLNNFVPFFVGIAFIMLLAMSSSYFMNVVGEEREDRTVEVLVTSVSPDQLIGGKVLGILATVATQLVGWSALTALAISIGGRHLGIAMLESLEVDLKLLAAMVAVAVPAYVLVAALMTALGAVVAEARDAQQMTGLFVLPVMIPFWLFRAIIDNPSSPLTVGLSLFPLTTLPTLSVRLSFSQVPTWQLAASVALTALCAGCGVWLAARAFRLGMLRYGQRLSLRELLPSWRETAEPKP